MIAFVLAMPYSANGNGPLKYNKLRFATCTAIRQGHENERVIAGCLTREVIKWLNVKLKSVLLRTKVLSVELDIVDIGVKLHY